ncbi:hypothetical protein LU11_gp302 [Pseudomonas phage Lu11]|uniref:hypothetical protein n=1 Tax=Pseudomonas phage Lu11 TaxID=1161927 RepID=UPI00025F1858|nr:hypothetical protein LU11_gp302 [Pseudomonas phage Lu11]AFH14833.1 hypothetical protein Lu11_0295 [Pseudomonas phage Lu11]
MRDFDQIEALLLMVEKAVQDNPSLLARIVDRATRGLQNKADEHSELRVNAEVALSGIFDLVPAAKLKANPIVAMKARQALVTSGMFAGTKMADELEAEISNDKTAIEAKRDKDAKEAQARQYKLRVQREDVIAGKTPHTTIQADALVEAARRGRELSNAAFPILKPYNAKKRDGSHHAWVIAVNEIDPNQRQPSQMLFIGKQHRRMVFLTDNDAMAFITKLREQMGEL